MAKVNAAVGHKSASVTSVPQVLGRQHPSL